MNTNAHASPNNKDQELKGIPDLDTNTSREQKMQFTEKTYKKTMIVFLCLLLFFSLISHGFFFTALFSIFYLAITLSIFGKKQGLQQKSSVVFNNQINPASGLPMVGGVDLHGNAYGSRHPL